MPPNKQGAVVEVSSPLGTHWITITVNNAGDPRVAKEGSTPGTHIKEFDPGQVTVKSTDGYEAAISPATFESHSSPGCTWYFFGGVWYRI